MKKGLLLLIFASIVSLLVESCSNSRKVTSNSLIQKRKYNKGWFIDNIVSSNKPKNTLRHNDENVNDNTTLTSKSAILNIKNDVNENIDLSKTELIAINSNVGKENKGNNIQTHKINTTKNESTKENKLKQFTSKLNEQILKKSAAKSSSGSPVFGIISLVTGVLGFLGCWFYYFGLLFSIAGVVFGIISLKKGETPKVLAILGIVFGGIVLLLVLSLLLFGLALLAAL
jgi:hypothetical protein